MNSGRDIYMLLYYSISMATICYSIHGRYGLRLRSGVGHQPYPSTNRCNELAGYISPLMAESMAPGAAPKEAFTRATAHCYGDQSAHHWEF